MYDGSAFSWDREDWYGSHYWCSTNISGSPFFLSSFWCNVALGLVLASEICPFWVRAFNCQPQILKILSLPGSWNKGAMELSFLLTCIQCAVEKLTSVVLSHWDSGLFVTAPQSRLSWPNILRRSRPFAGTGIKAYGAAMVNLRCLINGVARSVPLCPLHCSTAITINILPHSHRPVPVSRTAASCSPCLFCSVVQSLRGDNVLPR